MTWIIGIDEAGYGPNLGPLVVGATAWKVGGTAAYQCELPFAKQVPAPVGRSPARRGHGVSSAGAPRPAVDLYLQLSGIVCQVPDGERIAIADSKQLYKPASHAKKNKKNKSGLAQLERGVLTARNLLDRMPANWQAFCSPPPLPWYAKFDCPLPIDADPQEIANLTDQLAAHCQSAGIQLVELRTREVFPREFNQLVEHHGTKGAALSHISMELLTSVLTAHSLRLQPPAPTSIICDKHGGRNRYGALLQHHFPEQGIETLEESRPLSRYGWGPPEARVEICFRSQGEAELPVALASMAAKYQRELAMRAFNAYWTGQLPGLRPTAGYPQDAKRFKAEIAAVQSRLGIDDQDLWRQR